MLFLFIYFFIPSLFWFHTAHYIFSLFAFGADKTLLHSSPPHPTPTTHTPTRSQPAMNHPHGWARWWCWGWGLVEHRGFQVSPDNSQPGRNKRLTALFAQDQQAERGEEAAHSLTRAHTRAHMSTIFWFWAGSLPSAHGVTSSSLCPSICASKLPYWQCYVLSIATRWCNHLKLT